MRRLKKILWLPLAWLVSLLFLLEEWLWGTLTALMARIGALPWVAWLEQFIRELPPRYALYVFCIPALILLPAKFIGLHAITRGHWLIGSSVFIIAKIIGTALVARIFTLTKPALLSLPRFARFYQAILRFRRRIHDALEAMPIYCAARAAVHKLKQRIAQKFRGR